MATVAVIYPSGHKFDLDYYLKTHMPLVAQTWGHLGLKSYEIVQYAEGEAFQIQALLRWDSLESFAKARKDEVLADIPKFTDAQPVILSGTTKTNIAV